MRDQGFQIEDAFSLEFNTSANHSIHIPAIGQFRSNSRDLRADNIYTIMMEFFP